MLIVKIGEAPEAAIVVSVVSPPLTAIVVSELDDLESEPPHAANALVAASDKSAIDVIFRIEVMGTFQKLRQRGEAMSGRRQERRVQRIRPLSNEGTISAVVHVHDVDQHSRANAVAPGRLWVVS
jgi:hypothetical protein